MLEILIVGGLIVGVVFIVLGIPEADDHLPNRGRGYITIGVVSLVAVIFLIFLASQGVIK